MIGFRSQFEKRMIVVFVVFLIAVALGLFWAYRFSMSPKLKAGVDGIGVSFGVKGSTEMKDERGHVFREIEDLRNLIEQLRDEKQWLEKNKEGLIVDNELLRDEIETLEVEIEKLGKEVLEAKTSREIARFQQGLNARIGDENILRAEEFRVSEPESLLDIPDIYYDTSIEDQVFSEEVDYYVSWLRDEQTSATGNQKSYMCHNLNVVVFLRAEQDPAFGEACEIAGFQTPVELPIATENQKSYMCRNLNVVQFLSTKRDTALKLACDN